MTVSTAALFPVLRLRQQTARSEQIYLSFAPKLRHPEDKYDFFFLFNEIRNKKLPGMKVNFRLKNDDDNSYRDFEINGIPSI